MQVSLNTVVAPWGDDASGEETSYFKTNEGTTSAPLDVDTLPEPPSTPAPDAPPPTPVPLPVVRQKATVKPECPDIFEPCPCPAFLPDDEREDPFFIFQAALSAFIAGAAVGVALVYAFSKPPAE